MNTYWLYKFLVNTNLIESISHIEFDGMHDIDLNMLLMLVTKYKSKYSSNSKFHIFIKYKFDTIDQIVVNKYFLNIMELNPYLNFGKANIKTLKDECTAIDEFNIIEDDDHSPQNKDHIIDFIMNTWEIMSINDLIYLSAIYKFNKLLFFKLFYFAELTDDNDNWTFHRILIKWALSIDNEILIKWAVKEIKIKFTIWFKSNEYKLLTNSSFTSKLSEAGFKDIKIVLNQNLHNEILIQFLYIVLKLWILNKDIY